MAHRHKVHKAKGGRVAYDAQGSKVMHEAEEKKHGGAAEHHVHGKHGKHRLDKRARGGGIGANTSPFSTAARSGDIKKTPGNASSKIELEHGGKHTQHMHSGHK